MIGLNIGLIVSSLTNTLDSGTIPSAIDVSLGHDSTTSYKMPSLAFHGISNSATPTLIKKKSSILPDRIIAVFGTESSGSTFLATTLGIATGAFHSKGNRKRVVQQRAMSPNRAIEIQHLSLPSGQWFSREGNCDPTFAAMTEIVEAWVPDECLRIDGGKKLKLNMTAPIACREELHISEQNNMKTNNEKWSCGAKCGLGPHDGFALYPRRFFINITSHIEWYLSRGVDITVVLSMRDKSISHGSKLRDHCLNETITLSENVNAREIMAKALEKYGRRGRFKSGERVIAVSYEGLMSLKDTYLFDVYRSLGINSSYVPDFRDGNEKYVGIAKI